jgi:hypothetical protein
MKTANDIAAECEARDGCKGCPFAKAEQVCEECGQEIDFDYDSPLCGAEVDGLEPYLWPLDKPDLFSPPEFMVKHKEEIEQILDAESQLKKLF